MIKNNVKENLFDDEEKAQIGLNEQNGHRIMQTVCYGEMCT